MHAEFGEQQRFAIPEILGREERAAISGEVSGAAARLVATTGKRLRFSEFRACFKTIVRSTGIGTALSILPGVGQSDGRAWH